MMKKDIIIGSMLLVTVVVVALSVLPLGCLDSKSPTGTSETIAITENNSGQTIVAAAGDLISIELEENPTTGFQWNMSATDGLNLIDDGYSMDEQDEGMVGVGGIHHWTFEVSGTGEQQITAIYKRPWENVTGEEQSFEFTVEVLPTE